VAVIPLIEALPGSPRWPSVRRVCAFLLSESHGADDDDEEEEESDKDLLAADRAR